MLDEEDILEVRRPVSRWVRRAAVIIGAVLVAALLVVRFWPSGEDSASPEAVARSTPRTVPASAAPAWPTAQSACGDQIELPIVSSGRATRHTGLKLLVGGATLHVVDFDSGKYDDAAVHWYHSSFVTALAPGYAVIGTCAGQGMPATGVMRLGADGSAAGPVLPVPVNTVFADGDHAWGVAFPSEYNNAGSLVPLGGGGPRALPSGFQPIGITGGLVVGTGPDTANGPASLLLVDVATARVRENLGPVDALAVGHGVLVWSENCGPDNQQPCELHRRPVLGGATTSYRIPRPPGFSAGVLSPDGRRLAFTIERRDPDPRYEQEHPLPATDIALLHFDTGLLELVPSVELPAKTSPALAFSADGQWLAIALDTGWDIRLLAWRTGLALPIESTRMAGPVSGAPALQVLSAR